MNQPRLFVLFALLTLGSAAGGEEDCGGYHILGECLNETCLEGYVKTRDWCWPEIKYVFTLWTKNESSAKLVARRLTDSMNLSSGDVKTVGNQMLQFLAETDRFPDMYRMLKVVYMLTRPLVAKIAAFHTSVPDFREVQGCVLEFIFMDEDAKVETRMLGGDTYVIRLEIIAFKDQKYIDIDSEGAEEHSWFVETWCRTHDHCPRVNIPWEKRGELRPVVEKLTPESTLENEGNDTLVCRNTLDEIWRVLARVDPSNVISTSDTKGVTNNVKTSTSEGNGMFRNTPRTVGLEDGETTHSGNDKAGLGASSLFVVIVLSLF